MTSSKIFKGKITLNRGKSEKKIVNFDFCTHDIALDQVVMYGFKNFNFNDKERRELSSEHRRIIRQYQALCPIEIEKYSKKLVAALNSIKTNDTIEIKASDAGAFICLSAIFSGEIALEKKIIFKLESVPLKLFPRNLTKKIDKYPNILVKLEEGENSWLGKLDSLSQSPNYLSFSKCKKKIDDENEEFLKVG